MVAPAAITNAIANVRSQLSARGVRLVPPARQGAQAVWRRRGCGVARSSLVGLAVPVTNGGVGARHHGFGYGHVGQNAAGRGGT